MAAHLDPGLSSRGSIPEFFAGREVFITGGTGFMGKVLVERLLWTCRDISCIHLLAREKKDVSVKQRLDQLKESQIFDVVREHCSHQLEKLHIIPGDITKPVLGIDSSTLQQIDNVSIVFHLAASLKFNEALKSAVKQNVCSVQAILKLCESLPQMQVFVYVSTAYSNAELSTVEEHVYPAPAQLDQLLALVNVVPDDLLAEITSRLIFPKPNTYTFTKAMAESIVEEYARTASYSTAIFRPSIVVSALHHPYPGWIENLNGPNGIIVGIGKGILHSVSGAGGKRIDMIPVDIAIDTLIAAAWDTGVQKTGEVKVYNCSSYKHPIMLRDFSTWMVAATRDHPFDSPLWYPWAYTLKNSYIQRILATITQDIPLNLMEMSCQLFGIKKRLNLSVASNRLHAMDEALKFFALNEWHFSSDNVEKLRQRLSASDTVLFNLDVTTINWRCHVVNFVKGTRQFLLKEKPQDIEKARRNISMLHLVHQLTILLSFYFIWRTCDILRKKRILRAVLKLK